MAQPGFPTELVFSSLGSNDCTSIVEFVCPASVSLPGVSEVQAEEEQELNTAETSLQALEVASPRDCPSSPTSVAEEQVLNAAETSSKASEVASPGECPTSPTSAAEDQLLNAAETSSKASEVASPGECPTSHILVAEEQVLNAAENSSKALEVASYGECPSSPTSVVEEQVLNAAETASKALEVVSSYECPSSPTSVTEEQELNAGKSSSQASELALPRECPSSSVGANVSFMKGSDGMSTFVVPEETDHVEDVSTFLAPEETERMQDVSTFLAPEETERVQDVSTFLVPEETQRVQDVSTSIAPEETERVQDVSTFLAPEETERVQDASTFLAPEEAERVQDVSTSIAPEETERVQNASSFLAPEEAECVQDVSTSIAPEETERVQDVSTFIAPEETERVQNVSTFIAPEETQSVQDVSTFLAPEETPREQDFSTFLIPEETERVEDISTSLVPEETDRVNHYVMDEQQPAKRAKTSGTTYSGADAVAIVLGQTAEIVLVLAGMAHMRAGRIPTSYERELAATAYQNLGILVSQVAPNNLVTKESLERLLQDYNIKKVAQKKREDQAWVEALTEAEALANARVEAIARAKAEAAARVQAEMVARAQAEAAAKAEAEAEELERRRQAALKAAAIPAANGPSTGGFSSVGGSPLASGQSAYRVSELAQSPRLLAPGVHANSQAEMGSQVLLPVSSVGEIPRLVTQTEKSMSVNGQPHTLASKPTLGKPPKVRNRVRKEPAAFTLFAPEFLNVVQSQVPDPQKAHVTHKELCLGVQQFIREQIPPVSQNLQALPPTYISTPFPCQVCKLIAKDTGSVLVCDSCDEVSHVKCVQPPTSRGASKGDWNCPKCLSASRGGKYPSKYGPILYGSPNSVKLWPPHDMSQGNLEPSNSISIASVREREWAAGGRQISPELLAGQGKAGLEMDTRPHLSMEDATTGNFGNSPHLIVHLVNEPSPRTANPFSSSQSLFQEDKRGPFASEKSITSSEPETASQKVLTKHVATLKKTQVQGKTGMIMSDPSDGLKVLQGNQKFGKGLDKSDSQVRAGVVEDTAHEAKNRRATLAHNKKTETRTQANQSKKGNADSGVILASRPAEVPLPIVMEWVGDSGRRAEGKIYYQACSVGGITFSVSDCALFRPETPDVPPYIARLQVLWEDIATGHKWVRVSWCYYPTDIPLAMGRPGTTAPDEVYESNHCDNNLVGAIQGPCFVLTPLKFIEETERRRTLEKRGDAVEQLPPIFLARWMYDAPKGVFKPLPE